MEKRVIFHIPLSLDPQHASASNIRPAKLLEAFKQCGYEVDFVGGNAAERERKIKEVKKQILSGVRYDFLYSESSTMPTLLTESHHFPTHPTLDFSFMSFCKRKGIPIGLFYRDIHWRYINKNNGFKQRVAKYFYRYDLRCYEKLLDVLFVPSYDMFHHIPFNFHQKVVELPAGCDIHNVKPHAYDGQLKLLYIGGIGGNYDLRTFLKAVALCPCVSLTLCCREDDWLHVSDAYAPLLTNNIKLVHKQSEDLPELYSQSDLFAIFLSTGEYIKFAAPFKLFDTIGYGMPLFSQDNCWTGKFVKNNHIGIVCESTVEKIKASLDAIVDDPSCLIVYRDNTKKIAISNTWAARVNQIANALCK